MRLDDVSTSGCLIFQEIEIFFCFRSSKNLGDQKIETLILSFNLLKTIVIDLLFRSPEIRSIDPQLRIR